MTAGERGSGVETIAGPALSTADADEADRRLAARTRTGAAEILLTSEELAARAGLRTRQSVHDWRREGPDRRLAEREARLRLPGRAARRP